MPRATVDTSIPPPLRALGGWSDAEWFDASILDAGEVVGIGLPALAGLRKQKFELVERSVRRVVAGGPAGRRAAGGAPSGIAEIIEGAGALHAAAFRRPRFFFEAAPTLFFADIPAANLKARAAGALRQALIDNAFRGCVLACRTGRVAVMFWPNHETEITAFVRAATPPYPVHAAFDLADAACLPDAKPGRGRAGAPDGRASRDTPQRKPEDDAERARLIAEMDGLRARIIELQRKQSVQGAMETLGLDDARLRAMLLLLHPDRHGNSAAANEAAKWVNGLRDVLKTHRP